MIPAWGAMTASMRPGGNGANGAEYWSTSRASAPAVPGYHVPATAAGLVIGVPSVACPTA